MESLLLDAAGPSRSPATMPGYHQGRAPRNKGLRYPADPPTIEEIVAVMRSAGDRADSSAARADRDPLAGGIADQRSTRSRRDRPGPRTRCRFGSPGHSRGLRSAAVCPSAACCASSLARPQGVAGNPRLLASSCGAPQRLLGSDGAFHQLRHAHAIEMAHEGVPLVVIQRQLEHANLAITSVYLQQTDSAEIIDTVHSRPAPVISASAGLNGR